RGGRSPRIGGGRDPPLPRPAGGRVALEPLGGRARGGKLRALVHEGGGELRGGFEAELPRGVRARRDQPPQSWCRHESCIGATAPKLRTAPHMGEATEEVG